jgi:hypothetical protein
MCCDCGGRAAFPDDLHHAVLAELPCEPKAGEHSDGGEDEGGEGLVCAKRSVPRGLSKGCPHVGGSAAAAAAERWTV